MVSGRSVLEHPDRSTIERMFLSGWSAEKIHHWLKSRNKVAPAIDTLRAFRDKQISADKMLPPSVYALKLNQLDIQIDSLQELYNLLEIQKRRMGYLLDTEDKALITLPDTRKEMELLKNIIVDVIKLEMEMGIRERRPMELIEKKIDLNNMLQQFLLAKQGWAVVDDIG